jgi:hypothetical protein
MISSSSKLQWIADYTDKRKCNFAAGVRAWYGLPTDRGIRQEWLQSHVEGNVEEILTIIPRSWGGHR